MLTDRIGQVMLIIDRKLHRSTARDFSELEAHPKRSSRRSLLVIELDPIPQLLWQQMGLGGLRFHHNFAGSVSTRGSHCFLRRLETGCSRASGDSSVHSGYHLSQGVKDFVR